jgi:tetratricopeptide (TPR) repeat protein
MPQQKHTHTHTHTRILLFLLLPCFGQSDDSEESSLRSACGRLLISGSFSQSSAVSCTTLHSHKEDPLLQWRDANDLGMAHYILGDVDAAIDYFDNALLHAKPNILAPLRNIAWAYQAHHRPLDAANAWKRVAKEVGDLVFWGGEHPSRVLRANQGALTFEDIPSVGKLCQWPGTFNII